MRVVSLGGFVTSVATVVALCAAPASAVQSTSAHDPTGDSLTQDSADAAPAIVTAPVGHGERARVVAVRAGSDGPRVTTHRVVGGADARGMVQALQSDPTLLAVGVDHRVRAVGRIDPLRERQWNLDALDVATAWPLTTGRGVTVAVLDSGVAGTHPDLTGALVPGINTRGDRGDRSAPDTDDNGHGTHVAGIIAARAGNGTGGSGVAPDATIMPVKVLGPDGTGWLSDVTEGIIWATDHGASVINLSLGGPDADVMAPAVQYAQRHGVTVVAAAGNEGSTSPSYPAALPGVLSVAALDQHRELATYSNRGGTIDFTAPGSAIVSTVPGGYETMSGTSMAAPQVSGVVALLRSVSPVADPLASLQVGVTDLGSPGRDDRYGHGMVNAARSVAAACPGCAVAIDPAPASIPATREQSLRGAVNRVRVGRSIVLPARTDQGVAIRSWAGRSPTVCRLSRRDTTTVVHGLKRGQCRLKATAAATPGFERFGGTVTVRVTAR